ncbi:hypothetical protein V2G26_015114 [Clonostachys chloroleuca]|uniref:Uncharacterized protein n=1 Tax=Clonostachys chloroleuca TaxID=1926264 RepID=A0AA35Q4B5_9HYPO|nr:unnamed protein product [Clonostachys chloroleuca]
MADTTIDRPAIYLHVEMGVSWRPRKRSPKNHTITYASKAAREHLASVSQQNLPLPPAGLQHQPAQYQNNYQTNFEQFQAVPYLPFAAAPGQHLSLPPAVPYGQYHQPERQHDHLPLRRTRSGSFHERGHSAPPFNSAPWLDEPEPMTATALPQRNANPQKMKALPPTPDNFRLGEDDMPWTPTGPYAMEYYRDDDEEQPVSSMGSENRRGSVRPRNERDRGRTSEMEGLAAAMLTVDNGFEDQWWYQGSRLVNVAGDLITPSAVATRCAPGGTIRWPVADDDDRSAFREREPFHSMEPFQPMEGPVPSTIHSPPPSVLELVSPLSDFSSDTLNSLNILALKRSLNYNSDELHI